MHLLLISIIIVPLTLLITANSLLVISLNKFFRKRNVKESFAGISIIVAAKNEEDNITALIHCLANQEYEKERFEVIIVDDNSEDKTYCIAAEQIKNLTNFCVIKAEEKKYPAKKGALDFGISRAKFQHILITDADCLPEKLWIKSCAEVFSEGADFVFGPAPFTQGSSFINKISCFENLRSSILTFGVAALSFPYSAAARSFGFKKSSFEKIGGYSNTTETLGGDDDLLLREAIKNKLKIRTINNGEAYVFSEPKAVLKEYLKQKSRHAKTSVHYLPSRQFALGLWHTLNLACLMIGVFSFINPYFLLLPITKLTLDLIIASLFQKRFSYKFTLLEQFYLQMLYEVFLLINFFNAMVKKDRW